MISAACSACSAQHWINQANSQSSALQRLQNIAVYICLTQISLMATVRLNHDTHVYSANAVSAWTIIHAMGKLRLQVQELVMSVAGSIHTRQACNEVGRTSSAIALWCPRAGAVPMLVHTGSA